MKMGNELFKTALALRSDALLELAMLYELAWVAAIYGNDGEGAAIAEDFDLCYWCEQSQPCGEDHSSDIQRRLDDNLEPELARFGLEYNC